ncbi:hypothetical protein OCAR_5562 [Afipia carboxidovorans OM5]|uniref:Uncharacterized protein n=1 Tax=Afipia carboxidovorans (strain ATCC 49405 / DSM 1227 / KCTC 32145 / OM5) TaxID=504832 RepID=B6JEA4_AFIC5|nr:hypothetical protein [Afipia carboxidovorans]ACI92693.1 hypothetical protein OCAR_5562 [Afipia carboxidovorans OM5]AEI03553.1 hypothetical protein OCA4_c24330 [Afipia carboxidovorans OM4]AEI07130.1 hypothetical protein OCA5_c24340 [Afipia carboxidovorans OM5]
MIVNDYDPILQEIERQAQARNARVRQLLVESGRDDVLAEFDLAMREIANGVMGARATWHSLSSVQRFVLRTMAGGRYLSRAIRSKAQYDAIGRAPVVLNICKLSTARKLCAHGLIHVNGGATDPEAAFLVTERGRFVWRHGEANG